MILRHYPSTIKKEIWKYVRKNGYVCYYTKMPLDMTNPKSPWYLTFDHWLQIIQKKLVFTFLFNVMKSDLTEKELWRFINQLSDYKRKRLMKIKKMNPIYWYRLYPFSKVNFICNMYTSNI